MQLANMSDDLRKRYKIKDGVRGVVVTGVDANSVAADNRLSAGDVIDEVSQEGIANTADLQKRVDKLKKDGRKNALLRVISPSGDTRFVGLALQ
jgi:serine protease Do